MPYVFGYGSLVDRESVQSTLGRPVAADDGPYAAWLSGHRRVWNVAVPSSVRPDYSFVGPDGLPWQGWFGFLGLEAAASEQTLGALYRLTDDDLALLDARERSYDRTRVDHLLELAVDLPEPAPAYTYVPRPEVAREAARLAGQVCVMARYLRLVDRAYRALGDDLHAEHLRTMPDPAPMRVAEITVAPTDPAAVNQAVDPAPPDPAPR